jgi:hypothetical protein
LEGRRRTGACQGGLGADNADSSLDLFTAFQQQLGLKLLSTKAAVDVLGHRPGGETLGELIFSKFIRRTNVHTTLAVSVRSTRRTTVDWAVLEREFRVSPR